MMKPNPKDSILPIRDLCLILTTLENGSAGLICMSIRLPTGVWIEISVPIAPCMVALLITLNDAMREDLQGATPQRTNAPGWRRVEDLQVPLWKRAYSLAQPQTIRNLVCALHRRIKRMAEAVGQLGLADFKVVIIERLPRFGMRLAVSNLEIRIRHTEGDEPDFGAAVLTNRPAPPGPDAHPPQPFEPDSPLGPSEQILDATPPEDNDEPGTTLTASLADAVTMCTLDEAWQALDAAPPAVEPVDAHASCLTSWDAALETDVAEFTLATTALEVRAERAAQRPAKPKSTAPRGQRRSRPPILARRKRAVNCAAP